MGRHLRWTLCASVCLFGGLAWSGDGSAQEDPWSSGDWGDDVTVTPTTPDPPRSGRPIPPPVTTPTTPTTPSNPRPTNPTTPVTPPVSTPVSGVRREPADEAGAEVFAQDRVLTYEISVSSSDLARIDRQPSSEEKIRGSVRVNGRTYDQIAFRYKGSIGSFLAPCTSQQSVIGLGMGSKVGKCSIKLEFDEYDGSQRFHGMKKINLHAMGHDDAMLKERLGYSLYREMGIAAPRAAHARVVINGRLEGLFVAVEQIDKTFTRSRFEEGGEGNLYKEVWPMYDSSDTYRKALETNETEGNVTRMSNFKKAIDRGASAAAQFLDLSYMMRYLAVDRLIINDDGIMHWYCASQQGNNERRAQGNHNYYWYEARGFDRLWLVPWDLDNSFNDDRSDFTHVATDWRQSDFLCLCMPVGGVPQRAPSCDPLTRHLATFRSEYDAAVSELVRGPFSTMAVNAKLDAWVAQIKPYVEEAAGVRGAPSARSWGESVNRLRTTINNSRNNRGFRY
ncbi:MAG: CotH kinase family protein [Polyangiales bacterium]